MVLVVNPKFLQMLCGVQWSMPTALWRSAGLHWRVRVGTIPPSQSSLAGCKAPGSLCSPGLRLKPGCIACCPGCREGRSWRCSDQVAGCQGEERKEGGNVATFPFLTLTCPLWLVMVTCYPLLFLHAAGLVLGSSQLPAATLRVEPGDLQISESTGAQPGPPVVQRENEPFY